MVVLFLFAVARRINALVGRVPLPGGPETGSILGMYWAVALAVAAVVFTVIGVPPGSVAYQALIGLSVITVLVWTACAWVEDTRLRPRDPWLARAYLVRRVREQRVLEGPTFKL